MSRSRIIFFTVSFLLTFPMLAGTLLRAASRNQSPEDDSLYKYLSVFTEVLGLVRQSYVDAPPPRSAAISRRGRPPGGTAA